MGSFSNDFSNLEQNVQRLINAKKSQAEEILHLKGELENWKETSKSQVEEIEKLMDRNKILRIAEGAKGGDNREVKLKINEIVREVDKCIAQLNQ